MIFIEAAGNTKKSWLIVVSTYAAIALVVYLFCYKNTTERVVQAGTNNQYSEKLSFRENLKYVIQNKYWWILTINGIISCAVIALNMVYVLLFSICMWKTTGCCYCWNDSLNANAFSDSTL